MAVTVLDRVQIFKKLKFLSIALVCLITAFSALGVPLNNNIPLDQANLADAQILNWADKAVINIFTYDYTNYEQLLEEASLYFTPIAWKEFKAALQKSGNIKIIKQNKMKLTANLMNNGRIVSQGAEYGRYSWKIQVPIEVTYEDTATETVVKKERMITTLNIIRVSTRINPQGIAIYSINYYYIF